MESELLEEARRLGFSLAGIARATEADGFEHLRNWLDQGHAGEMAYLHKHAEARRHPRSIYPEVKSVVMVGMNYDPTAPQGAARLARYAQARDYHVVLREQLWRLRDWLRAKVPHCWGRAVVDTAPLLERDFARRAGLGWFGKNTMLIHPRQGSWFVLGALLVNLELQPTPSFDTRHCGRCTACLDACPTQAFVAPFVLDARRCISYLTIELKHAVPETLRFELGDWLFGCDVCQEVCPWNRKAPPGHPLLAAKSDLLTLDACELLLLDEDAFRQRFDGTALYPRPGRAVVLRNAALILGNSADASALVTLQRASNDTEPLIREAAVWAMERIRDRLHSVTR